MNERSEAIRVGGQVRRARHRTRFDSDRPAAPVVPQRQRLDSDRPAPPLDASPELADAWHALQLHWLAHVPGYREQVQAKLRDRLAVEIVRYGACKGCGGDLSPTRFTQGCRQCDWRKASRKRADVDKLGHQVDGCG